MPIEEYVSAIRARLPKNQVRLARTPKEERDLISGVEVATGITIEPEVLDHAERLRLFACVYAGTDHLPMDALGERDIAVTNASGVHGPNIAEWVIGMLLVFARNLHIGFDRQQRREWRHYRARELNGSTVTVIGLGAIGQAIVDRLGGFNVRTIGIRYTPEKGGETDEVLGYDPESVHDALSRTDYLVIACPLTETTRGLIDGAALKTLPSSAVLVNIARGPVVNTNALVRAVQGEGLRGVALDVTDPEPLPPDHVLWNFQNVLITPHNSGHTPAYYERVADILAENMAHVEETSEFRDLRNQVITS